MRLSHPEILAPAGSMESLEAAVRAGADAVYVGGKRFSARNGAENFSEDELASAADYCHLRGVKLYLAVNTIISDDETDDFCRFIKAASMYGIDGFIVQDYGCARLIRECVPDAVLHASTQMTVMSHYGAKLLMDMGYVRAVPARELDERTIKAICDTGIETEIFVHGALCMSVSGQCYMSAMIGSRSANRGCCGQACRLPFSAVGKHGVSALSLKDLSLLPIISRAKEIGCDSFKIEGRMKRPEYTASAVSALRGAVKGEKPDMLTLRKIFSRSGFTDGYFTGERRDMFGVREKEDVAAAKDVFPKIHELYRFERKARVLEIKAVIKAGQPFSLTAVCGNVTASVTGDIPEKALNRPTDLDALTKQLGRLGDTVYTLGSVDAVIGEGLTVPSGKINELRRRLVTETDRLIIESERPKYTITEYTPEHRPFVSNDHGKLPIRVSCRTADHIKAASDAAEMLIVPTELALKNGELLTDKEHVIVSPPRFISDCEKTFSELKKLRDTGFSHLLCHTPDTIEMGRRLGYTLHGGFGLNVFNSMSVRALAELGLADVTASIECTAAQLDRLEQPVPVGAVIGGRLPLMLTRNCPIKNEIGCSNCTGTLTDRTGRSFKVQCSGEFVEILNSDILFMADRLHELSSARFGIIMLSDEDECSAKRLIDGIKPDMPITRGLFYRGI